jgi:hypothetical protein
MYIPYEARSVSGGCQLPCVRLPWPAVCSCLGLVLGLCPAGIQGSLDLCELIRHQPLRNTGKVNLVLERLFGPASDWPEVQTLKLTHGTAFTPAYLEATPRGTLTDSSETLAHPEWQEPEARQSLSVHTPRPELTGMSRQ